MIRDIKELSKMSDEEFNSIIAPFDKKVSEYISENIINQFVAYYIATGYEMSAIWNSKLDQIIDQAIFEFSQFTSNDCDIKKMKSILNKKYGLKIISHNPTKIKERSE